MGSPYSVNLAARALVLKCVLREMPLAVAPPARDPSSTVSVLLPRMCEAVRTSPGNAGTLRIILLPLKLSSLGHLDVAFGTICRHFEMRQRDSRGRLMLPETQVMISDARCNHIRRPTKG